MDIETSQSNFLDLAMNILADGTCQDLETFFGTAWAIWYNRNHKIFEDNNHLPFQTWNFAKRFIQEFKEASQQYGHKKHNEEDKWNPPPIDMYKINVDGAASEDSRQSSIRVIIRNCKRETIATMCTTLPGQYSSLETKTIVVEKGALLARELELQ